MCTSSNGSLDDRLVDRLRRSSWRVLAGALVAMLLAVGCSSSTQLDRSVAAPQGSDGSSTDLSSTEAAAESAGSSDEKPAEAATSSAEPTAEPSPTPTPNPIAEADTELPPAPIGLEALAAQQVEGPQPVGIVIEDIGVSDAEIIPVGVNEDLTFEVPPADQVGWYEFGPTPGETGSSVLAAHIAYNGRDGVFRYLADVEVGAVVSVQFDDGSSRRFRIETVTDYVKEALPDSLFARDGREQLALITCGGAFNEQLDSYESNTVAVAVPIDSA
jgi:LPXTG-site transpeptidase (sortase) family protein